jgi:hypothetical protein
MYTKLVLSAAITWYRAMLYTKLTSINNQTRMNVQRVLEHPGAYVNEGLSMLLLFL